MVRDTHRIISFDKMCSFEMDLAISSALDSVCHVLFPLFRLSGKHNQAHRMVLRHGLLIWATEVTSSSLSLISAKGERALGTNFFFSSSQKDSALSLCCRFKACCTVPNKCGHICNRGCRWDLNVFPSCQDGPLLV